jgi:methionine synthase II (cobalamin-independent)
MNSSYTIKAKDPDVRTALDTTKAKDPDMRAALGALRRAALSARKTAIQTDTHLVVMKDGHLRRIAAAELMLHEVASQTKW